MKKLFLDDIRTVEMVFKLEEVNDFDVVRSYEEFIAYIKSNGPRSTNAR